MSKKKHESIVVKVSCDTSQAMSAIYQCIDMLKEMQSLINEAWCIGPKTCTYTLIPYRDDKLYTWVCDNCSTKIEGTSRFSVFNYCPGCGCRVIGDE